MPSTRRLTKQQGKYFSIIYPIEFALNKTKSFCAAEEPPFCKVAVNCLSVI